MTAPAERPQPRPSVFFIKNHTGSQLFTTSVDELPKFPPRPAGFADKNSFLMWSHNAATDHVFYSLVEPATPSLRTDRDNPARLLHGVVADFDCRIDRDTLLKGIAKAPADYPVAYASSTFSGGARLLWLFENPVALFGGEHTKQLLLALMKELNVKKLLAGLDTTAFIAPTQYYELGTDWIAANPDARISRKLVEYLSFKAAQKQDVSTLGPSIPIEVVAAEIERRFPGRWQGPFVVGARGPRFWDSTARNPEGAWVRDTGVFAFTGEGRFLPWAEILGRDFVQKFEQDRISAAVQDCYYDYRLNRYWRRNGGEWTSDNADVFCRDLVNGGLNPVKRTGSLQSEVQRAQHYVEKNCRIDGVAPFLFRDKVIVEFENKRYLNVSRVRPVQPKERGGVSWGDGFPWIAKFLELLFPDHTQRSVFLGWLARFYVGAINNSPTRGHILVVVGPPGAGKGFLTDIIVGGLMGGVAVAETYLTGKDQFNAPLFESPVWAVGDALSGKDRSDHKVWSEKLKSFAANFKHTCRDMHRAPVTVECYSRIVVSMNEDEDSIEMLPGLEKSADDKFIFLLSGSTKGEIDFSDIERSRAAARSELADFGAFLRDYRLPDEFRGEDRYGVVAYKHPKLKQRAADNSPVAAFVDVLDYWRSLHFRTSDDAEWTGGAIDLLRELHEGDGLEYCKREFSSPRQVGRYLAQAARREIPWIKEGPRHRERGAQYVILRPERESTEPTETRIHRTTIKPSAAA